MWIIKYQIFYLWKIWILGKASCVSENEVFFWLPAEMWYQWTLLACVNFFPLFNTKRKMSSSSCLAENFSASASGNINELKELCQRIISHFQQHCKAFELLYLGYRFPPSFIFLLLIVDFYVYYFCNLYTKFFSFCAVLHS